MHFTFLLIRSQKCIKQLELQDGRFGVLIYIEELQLIQVRTIG